MKKKVEFIFQLRNSKSEVLALWRNFASTWQAVKLNVAKNTLLTSSGHVCLVLKLKLCLHEYPFILHLYLFSWWADPTQLITQPLPFLLRSFCGDTVFQNPIKFIIRNKSVNIILQYHKQSKYHKAKTDFFNQSSNWIVFSHSLVYSIKIFTKKDTCKTRGKQMHHYFYLLWIEHERDIR